MTTVHIVVGAGLAGAAVAFHLARRRYSVTVFESMESPASAASGNREGILTPYLADRPSNYATLYGAGFEYTRSILSQLSDDIVVGRGAIQHPSTPRLRRILKDSKSIPETLVVSIPLLVRRLLSDPKITVRTATKFELSDESPSLIIANAYQASMFEICKEIPLEPVRGETWLIPENIQSKGIRETQLAEVYLTPSRDGFHLMGGSFRHNDTNPEPDPKQLEDMLRRLRISQPNFEVDPDLCQARVCFRTSTHDRLPYIGRLPDFEIIRSEAAKYRSGTDLSRRFELKYKPGRYVSLGHGSRGLTTCLLAGEIIARQICGEPPHELEDLVGLSRLLTARRFGRLFTE